MAKTHFQWMTDDEAVVITLVERDHGLAVVVLLEEEDAPLASDSAELEEVIQLLTEAKTALIRLERAPAGVATTENEGTP